MASFTETSSAAPATVTSSSTATISNSIPANTNSNTADLPENLSLKNISQSSRDRIDSILEGARERTVAMGSTKGSKNGTKKGGDSDSLSPGGGRDTESSADEETNIMRRSGSNLNYQSTATAGQQHRKTARSQPSTQSIRRSERVNNGSNSNVAGEGNDEEAAGEHQGWWAKVLSEYGSIELENKGSVARDHLALERTFLAWLRTSLAFASIGIAITQLFRLNTSSANSGGDDPYRQLRQMGKPLGATFLSISIVMLFIGFHRYFESQHWIIRGKFPASRGSIALVAGITFALMVTSLVVVIVVEPKAFEKR